MSSGASATLLAVDLGRVPYAEAWELQRRLVDARAAGAVPDLLLLCEHDEVVTVGRRAQAPGREPLAELAAVAAAGIPVLQVERGGAATYHGPGQVVGYPIVLLRETERDLHAFLRAIEEALIEVVDALTGLRAARREGLTGVWVGERKVASLGVACRRWVTYHGFALNVGTDLTRFTLLRPCDLSPEVMASLESLGQAPARGPLQGSIVEALARRLRRTPRWGTAADLAPGRGGPPAAPATG